jgi:hypothetical protein
VPGLLSRPSWFSAVIPAMAAACHGSRGAVSEVGKAMKYEVCVLGDYVLWGEL